LIILACIPFIFGFLLASRLLRESERYLRWALAYALGLLAFVAVLNAFFHIVSFRYSVYLTIGALAAGAFALTRVHRSTASTSTMNAFESIIIPLLALTAAFIALFWQMNHSDDDFFIHGPLMALYLRDIFPPHNPWFPDLPLRGHYGRDLTIAGVSALSSDRFLAVQYVFTALNQAAVVFVAHFTARRYLRSATQALLAVLLAYLAVINDARTGLLETFQNNNSFANLFLFTNLYLYLTALGRRRYGLVILSGCSLGTYALVYETNFGLLMLLFVAFPFALALTRRRWRARYFTMTFAIIALAGALAVFEGGALTDVVNRRMLSHQSTRTSEDVRRMTQQITITFPKHPARITSWRGDTYSVWTWRIVREAGLFVGLLPLSAVLMVVNRRPWGILLAGLSVLAILVPALVDFGAFNSESLRFLMLAGVAASMLGGIVIGEMWEYVRRQRWRASSILGMTVASMLVASCWPSIKWALRQSAEVVFRPTNFFLSAERWACNGSGARYCEPIDVLTAIRMQPLTHGRDRTLVGIQATERRGTIYAHAVVAMFARTFLTGAGLVVSYDQAFSMLRIGWHPVGFRARVFWKTGDVGLLDDLRADYLLLDPDGLDSGVYWTLQHEPRLERVLRHEDRGLVREVYRVRAAPSPLPTSVQDVRVLRINIPNRFEPAEVYGLTLAMSSATPLPRIRGSALIRTLDGVSINAEDEVRHIIALRRDGRNSWTGTLWFVTPFEAGEYEVALYAWDGPTRRPMTDGLGKPIIFTIRVD